MEGSLEVSSENSWVIAAKKGQLLRVRKYTMANNGLTSPKYRSLVFQGDEVVMFLGVKFGDWRMAGGPKGPMRHRLQNYTISILHEEHIWEVPITICEGSYNEFEMKFKIIEIASRK